MAITFGPDGTLYGITPDAAGNSLPGGDLVTINPATGAISVVGVDGLSPLLDLGLSSSLAFVGESFYTFRTSNELFSIDPATGAATAAGYTK